MQKRKAWAKSLLVAGALAPQLSSATDGYFASGYGMKSVGMGGAAVAVAQEPFGGAVNPGAMSFLGSEWQLGVFWSNPDSSVSRTGSGGIGLNGSATSDSRNFFIPEFGINWKYRPDLAFGITVYDNGGIHTEFPGGTIPAQNICSLFFTSRPGPWNVLCGNGSLGVDLTQRMIAPYASWQFAKGQSVGIAPVIAYQRFKSQGLQAFDHPVDLRLNFPPPQTTSVGNVTNNGYSSAWGVGARVGYVGQFTDAISIGGAYATKISMGKLGEYKGLLAEQGRFDIPWTFTVGVAIRPTAQWLLALDYERISYGGVPSLNNPSAPVLNCARRQPDNCLGGSSGAGFGWQSIGVWKLGVQHAMNDQWTLRGGYHHSDNPIRPQDVTFNIIAPGVVQKQYSVGATYAIDNKSEVTGAFMVAANNSVTGPSLFGNVPPPPNAVVPETIGLKERLLGIAYSRKF